MTRKRWIPAVGLLLLALFRPAGAAERALTLETEKYTLSNGLDVILHEDHSVPIVDVNLWYHVGSKNEKPGRTGFAHLFEHMMFQGTPHFGGEFFAPIQEIGGDLNGSTTEDRTNYWENVPSNYLELVLAMESDRMGFLPDALTQEKLDNQRDVVKNERRQRVDNQPYGHAEEILLGLLFPEGHPYSWTVIGSMDDLSAATLDDVKEFFRTYYAPNNASLCLAGDFDPGEVRRLVESYFGTIPPGPPVERVETWTPKLDGVRRARAEDAVELPRLYMVWHTPARYAPEDAEMDLLASVLGSGKTSRLYQSLVYERQIAQDVSVYQESRSLGGLFHIEVTAQEGHTLDEIEEAVDGELETLLAGGVTGKELDKAKIGFEASFVRRLQRLGGFRGRANVLNGYNTFLGSPDRLQWDVNRYDAATTESVMEAARRSIDLGRRAILRSVPQGKLAESDIVLDRDQTPGPEPEPSFTPPAIERQTLPNGLEILLVEDHRLPLVDLRLVLKRGWSSDPSGRFGTSAITLAMLDDGTESRSALEIADEAKSLGTRLWNSGSFDGSIVGMNVLAKNFDGALDLLADVVLHPTFPKEELERQRQIYLGRIRQEKSQPLTTALKTFMRILYGEDHPYSQPFTGSGTEESIRSLAREDLVRFHNRNYHPNLATVVLCGDITMEEAKKKIDTAFHRWKRGASPTPDITPPARPEGRKIYVVDKPGAAQSAIIAGNLSLTRSDPDYTAFTLLHTAFGGQFTSRLNLNLREEKGYTYGAQSEIVEAKSPAPFIAFSEVHTEYTKESVAEFLKEFEGIAGGRPVTADELAFTKSSLLKGFPQDFETIWSVSGRMATLAKFSLPLDDWALYRQRVEAVSGDDLLRLGRKYVHPGELLVVVVGDREKIEEGLRGLGAGEVIVLDEETARHEGDASNAGRASDVR